MKIDFSAQGSKQDVRAQASKDLKGNAMRLVWNVVDNAPGSHISIQVSQTEAQDGKSGRLHITASFWTV